MEIVRTEAHIFDTFILITGGMVALIVLWILFMMRKIRATMNAVQLQASREQTAIDQAMRTLFDAQPFAVRVNADIEEGMYLMGRAVVDSCSTAQEAVQAFSRMIGGSLKTGQRDQIARKLIDEMEADAPLPPAFWAVEGIGGRWLVLYELPDGSEFCCFPPAYPEMSRSATALEARYVAARLNLHPESVVAGRDLLSYEAYRPELAALFGEVYGEVPLTKPS